MEIKDKNIIFKNALRTQIKDISNYILNFDIAIMNILPIMYKILKYIHSNYILKGTLFKSFLLMVFQCIKSKKKIKKVNFYRRRCLIE